MLGKNNFKERLHRMENQDKHDRFSIRKLSIGAASVLIGFAFVTGVGTHTTLADELNSGDQQPTAEVKSADDASQGVDTEVKNDNEQNGGQDVKTDQAKPEAAKGATPKVVAPVKTQQDQVAGTKIEQSTDKQEERQVSVAKDNQNGKQEEKTTTLATQSEVVNKQAIGSEEKADSNQVIKVQNLVSKKEFAVGLSQEEKTVKGPKKIALAKANAASESVVDKLNSGKSLTDSELESEMNKFNDVLESGKKLTDLPADQQAEFDSLINYIKNDHTFRPMVLSAMHNVTINFATYRGYSNGEFVSTTTISVPDGFIGFITANKLISDYHCSLPKGYTFEDPNQRLSIAPSANVNVAWCFIKPKEEIATVHYVDDDDLSRSIPDGTTSGNYGTSVNYSSLVPSDYTLANPGSYTFTDAANQSFTIYLKEGTREARPGDGGTSDSDYSKTVTRSFNVTAPDGHTVTAPSTQSITLTRSGTYNVITKKVTFGNWSKGQFTAVTAPTITGYTAHASANNVDETIGGGATAPSNETVTITYTINEESATVHYVDDDDLSRSIPDGTTSGNYGTSVNYSSLVPSDYTLASPGSYTFTDAANQSFTIYLKEGTREARPGDGGTSDSENNSTSTVNTNNNDSEEPTAPVTYQQLVLYIGKHGRIVKKGYITVSEDNDSLTEMFRLAKVKSKMPKGYKATGKIKKVAKYLYVWVTKKNQPSFNEAPRTKDVLYVAKNGKIVKRTRITGSVRKLAKSKLPKGYKISGIDRVNNHYDVWIKKEK
ncbi:adhesion exoprotein [Lactobacillus amylovorus GRL 1112]|uniref:Adhesion exoprotein n=1 Tax=Lactobacillus amylovorus (strain GRL 1112) TaxID=695560 RepID=E4SLH3_LACAR|nr:YSIRK-type signal peptide-containing protein [Lactobacillus amylovorus]ADQ58431.1 adhesion exoprotein [Lactobacillus amylovorus GRL 1112]